MWQEINYKEDPNDLLVPKITYKINPAEIESIEPYGPEGRYKINFKDKAKTISSIPFGTAKSGAMQGPRFCNWLQLENCNDLGKIL